LTLTISDDTTINTLITVFNLAIASDKTLTVPLGLLQAFYTGKTYSNLGIISGLYFQQNLKDQDKSISPGTITCDYRISSIASATADRTVTFTNVLTVGGQLTIESLHASYKTIIDLNDQTAYIGACYMTGLTQFSLGDATIVCGGDWQTKLGTIVPESSTLVLNGTYSVTLSQYGSIFKSKAAATFHFLHFETSYEVYGSLNVTGQLKVDAGVTVNSRYDNIMSITVNHAVPLANNGTIKCSYIYLNHTATSSTIWPGTIGAIMNIGLLSAASNDVTVGTEGQANATRWMNIYSESATYYLNVTANEDLLCQGLDVGAMTSLTMAPGKTLKVGQSISINGTGPSEIYLVDPYLNALDYLPTETYDGSGEIVHPDVLRFPSAWNGYLYWMGMTPYPAANAALENPSILASNDGITWEVPDGLTNPIESYGGASDNWCDSDLVYVAATDEVRYYFSGYGQHYYKSSTDGITWGANQSLSFAGGNAVAGGSIQIVSSRQYWWGMDAWTLYRIDSADGISWTNRTVCTLIGTIPDSKVPWHCDVSYDSISGEFLLVMAVCDAATSGANTSNVFAYSYDGLTWNLQDGYLIDRGLNGWDGDGSYRSSIFRTGDTVQIWYTGIHHIDPSSPYMHGHVGYFVSELNHVGTVISLELTAITPRKMNITDSTTFTLGVSGLSFTLEDYDGRCSFQKLNWTSTNHTFLFGLTNTSTKNVVFTLTNLVNGVWYTVYVDGALLIRLQAHARQISFMYSGTWSEHTFAVTLSDSLLLTAPANLAIVILIMLTLGLMLVFLIPLVAEWKSGNMPPAKIIVIRFVALVVGLVMLITIITLTT
jgi:hypothetical protein